MLLFRFSAVRGWSIFVIYSNFEKLTPSAVYVSVAQVIEMRGLSKDAPMRISKKLPPLFGRIEGAALHYYLHYYLPPPPSFRKPLTPLTKLKWA